MCPVKFIAGQAISFFKYSNLSCCCIKFENALQGMPVPLHPGAEKFYKEKGLIK